MHIYIFFFYLLCDSRLFRSGNLIYWSSVISVHDIYIFVTSTCVYPGFIYIHSPLLPSNEKEIEVTEIHLSICFIQSVLVFESTSVCDFNCTFIIGFTPHVTCPRLPIIYIRLKALKPSSPLLNYAFISFLLACRFLIYSSMFFTYSFWHICLINFKVYTTVTPKSKQTVVKCNISFLLSTGKTRR